MGNAQLKLTESNLTLVLNSNSNDGQKSISHRETGFSGSLVAKYEYISDGYSIVFYFRNQSAGTDQTLKIGVWKSKRTKKQGPIEAQELLPLCLQNKNHKITLNEAFSIYRHLGLLANEHPDIKAYLVKEKTRQENQLAEAKRLADIEARKGTVQHLLDAYLASMEGRASYKEVISIFKNVPNDIRAMYAKDVLSEHITKIISDYVQQPVRGGGIGNKSQTNASANKHTTGDKIRKYLNAAFNFGMKADNDPLHHVKDGRIFNITFNPVSAVKCIDPKNADTRCIENYELLALLQAINELDPINRALALTHVYFGGQRIRQLFKVNWDGITDTSILLSDIKGRGKTAKTSEHLVPITPRIKEILAPLYESNRHATSLFSFNGVNNLNPDTITKLFIRLNKKLVKQKKAGSFTARHIRVACETYLSSKGFDEQARAWLLSHGRKGAQAKHYDRYDHWKEKVAALTVWQSFLDELQGNNVVSVDFSVVAA